MPATIIGIESHCPIERFKKSKPRNWSGSLVNSIKNLNADGSPKPKKEVPANKTVKEDGKEQKAKNPSEEKPKEEKDPKGTFVSDYKGYKIYKKDDGKFESRLGGGPVTHTDDSEDAAKGYINLLKSL